MKDILNGLNKAFENRVRLGIMSALLVNDWLDFSQLKELLGVTDGNLSTHLKSLEEKQFISVNKEFINRKPKSKYTVTQVGKQAFQEHITAIERLLK